MFEYDTFLNDCQVSFIVLVGVVSRPDGVSDDPDGAASSWLGNAAVWSDDPLKLVAKLIVDDALSFGHLERVSSPVNLAGQAGACWHVDAPDVFAWDKEVLGLQVNWLKAFDNGTLELVND